MLTVGEVDCREPSGTIKVEKQTQPDGSPEEFAFTGALSGSIGDGGSIQTTVEPGAYEVRENPPFPWLVASITCDDGDSSGNVIDGNAVITFNVRAGESVTCVVTNRKQNQPPDAANDFVSIPKHGPGSGPQTFSPLGNDSDPDRDPLRITSPTHLLTRIGTVDCGSETCRYVPDKSLGKPTTPGEFPHWTDQFSYTITDGNGHTDTATVFIDIHQPQPCGGPPCGPKG
jgi:hypothetical protein